MTYSRALLKILFTAILTLGLASFGQARVEDQITLAAADAPAATSTSGMHGMPTKAELAAMTPAQREKMLEAIQAEMQNPLSNFYMLQNQITYFEMGGDRVSGSPHMWNWNIQPIMPVSLGGDWMLINRPVIPLVGDFHYYDSDDDEVKTKSGVSDIQYLALFGKTPKKGKPVIAGGFTLEFPTADPRDMGSEKWSIGPSFVWVSVGQTHEMTYGFILQQWWSFAGPKGAEDVNKTQIIPVYWYNLPKGWSIGGQPYWNANWEQNGDDVWNIPLQFMVSKILKAGELPMKIQFGWQYSVVREDDLGTTQAWQLEIIPIIPH
mgnify:CR=1 FL=1